MYSRSSLVSDHTLHLVLLLLGSGLFHVGLYSLATSNPLPTYVVLVGIFLMSLSVTMFGVDLLRNSGSTRPENFYVLYGLVLSISFAFTRLSRFAGAYSGADIVRESEVSIGTYLPNFWQPSLGQLTNYQSSLAVTILPSMIGRTIGVASNSVLLIQSLLMMALLPVAVQAVTSNLTGSPRLAALCGILISTNWFFFGAHLIGKTEVALFLLTLSVYSLARTEGSIRSLGVLLGVGVVMSHYTIGLYYAGVLLIILLWSKLFGPMVKLLPWFKRLTIPRFHTWRPILAIGIVLLWLAYAAPMILPELLSALTSSITGLASGGAKDVEAALPFGSGAGPIVTGWFDFQNGLFALGALLAINYYRKGRIIGALAIWTVTGVFLVALPLAWIILPRLSLEVEATRVLLMIFPFSILLVARLFMRVYSFPSNIWKGIIVILLFLLIPMNSMLLNPQSVLYQQASSLTIDKRVDLESSFLPYPSNHAMTYWADKYLTTGGDVEADSISHYALYNMLPFPSKISPIQEDFPPYLTKRYDVLSYYFIQYHTWTKSSSGTVVTAPGTPSVFFQFPREEPTRDVVYSSARFWILSPPHNVTR